MKKKGNKKEDGNKKENKDKKEDSKAEHYEELEGHDMECPTCGCALGQMYLKAGLMRKMYGSDYDKSK